MPILLLVIALAGAALYCAGLYTDLRWLIILSKVVPVLCLLIWLSKAPEGIYRRWIGLGLAFSLLGDVLLAWPQDLFVFGLSAFFVAHLAYLRAYCSDSKQLAPVDLGIAVAAAGGMFYVLQEAGLGELYLPVALYSAVIACMLWRALARIGQVPAKSAWLAAGGASLFVFSDSLIGLNRFVTPISGAEYAIILCYWLGQWAICASAVMLEKNHTAKNTASLDLA